MTSPAFGAGLPGETLTHHYITGPPPVELRPYQRDALGAIHAALGQGHTRFLSVMATGTGKTLVFVALARQLQTPCLVLVHRDELIRQTIEKFRRAGATEIGVVRAKSDELDAPVVIASVPTLAADKRLRRLAERHARDPFGLVVVDEAHHATADTWRRVLETIRPTKLLLGVTATPDRTDKNDIGALFGPIAFSYGIGEAVSDGWLADPVGIEVRLDVNLDRVRTSRGDWDASALWHALRDANAPKHVAESCQRYAPNRRTIVFVATVEQAEATARAMRSVGINAQPVWGNEPAHERDQRIADFRDGRLQALVNVNLLVEGFDDSDTDAIVIACPTQSRLRYAQMIGRGLRKKVDNRDCLVLDLTGASSKHTLVTLATLTGLHPDTLKRHEGSYRRALAEERERKAARRHRRGELVARAVPLLGEAPEGSCPKRAEDGCVAPPGHNIAGLLKWEPRDRQVAWFRLSGADYGVNVDDESVVIERQGNEWSVTVIDRDNAARSLGAPGPLHWAQGTAETYIRAEHRKSLWHQNARWRHEHVTEAQRNICRARQIAIDPEWRRGDAAKAIARAILDDRLSVVRS